jgi:hypothetical protein
MKGVHGSDLGKQAESSWAGAPLCLARLRWAGCCCPPARIRGGACGPVFRFGPENTTKHDFEEVGDLAAARLVGSSNTAHYSFKAMLLGDACLVCTLHTLVLHVDREGASERAMLPATLALYFIVSQHSSVHECIYPSSWSPGQ